MRGMESSIPKDEHPNDLLNAKKQSTKDQYYSFMLRQEKLRAIENLNAEEQFLDDEETKALSSISELEKLELKVLGRLMQLSDVSPQLLQVKAITGKDSREEIAHALADMYYRKYMVEDVLNRFVAPTESKNLIVGSARKSQQRYDAFA